MGPGGVISGTHLRFSALDDPGSLCSICFTGCHFQHFQPLSFSASISNLDATVVNKISYKTMLDSGELPLRVLSCCAWTHKSSNSLNLINKMLFIGEG